MPALPRRRMLWILGAAVALGAGTWLAIHRGAAGVRTIVLVTVDTLRRDRVGAYGSKTVTTPRMDEIAARGVRFDDARTPAPLTLPAHTTMMTGLSPASHGVRVNHSAPVPARAARRYSLLAERLSDHGRRCGAFVSAGPLAATFGLGQGFEIYDDEGLEDSAGLAYPERRGVDTVGRALAWLRRLPKDAPAFLWVHLFEPHAPHELGGALGYDADVALADGAVGMLLDGLQSLGRGDAAICLAADHGEALGELGEDSHGWLLGESVLRVPLLLSVPGGAKGAVRTDPVELADIAPTLLHLAGIEEEAQGAAHGFDLLSSQAPRDRVRVAETTYAWQQFRWAQLVAATGAGWKLEDRGESRERLIRLSDEGPPYQESGVAAAGRVEAAPLAAALREYRRERAGGTVAGPAGGAPIGYLAGGPIGDLLEPKANGALPDPYAVISDAGQLLTLHNMAMAGSVSGAELLKRLDPISKRDPKNPLVALVRGLILTSMKRVPEAVVAYRSALDLGRVEPGTLLLAAGAAAETDPKAGLALLRAYPVAPDTQILLLEARLCAAVNDPEGAKLACQRARKAVRGPRDRAKIEAESGCK